MLIELHDVVSRISVPLADAAARLAADAVPMSGVVDGKLIGSVPPAAIKVAPVALALSEHADPVAKLSAPLASAIPAL
jgi:hypothetical protein